MRYIFLVFNSTHSLPSMAFSLSPLEKTFMSSKNDARRARKYARPYRDCTILVLTDRYRVRMHEKIVPSASATAEKEHALVYPSCGHPFLHLSAFKREPATHSTT